MVDEDMVDKKIDSECAMWQQGLDKSLGWQDTVDAGDVAVWSIEQVAAV